MLVKIYHYIDLTEYLVICCTSQLTQEVQPVDKLKWLPLLTCSIVHSLYSSGSTFMQFVPFNLMYTKSRKKLTAELHAVETALRRKRGDRASKELLRTRLSESFFLMSSDNRGSLQVKREQQHPWAAWYGVWYVCMVLRLDAHWGKTRLHASHSLWGNN